MARGNMELSVPAGTPWGPVAAVVLCFAPVLFLLATTLYKPLLLSSSLSLPLSALLMAFIRLAYLSSPALLVLANVAVGALQGLVPLAVTFGAVLLFEVMAATGCLQYMMRHVRRLSAGNRVAEVFLIGWAFAYTISGVSGLSTPMALATPMLVSLGHDPLMSLVAVIGLNGAAAHLGSVGMTIWFGFRTLNLAPAVILQVGAKSSVLLGACAFVVAPVAASFLMPWKDLACNTGFILVSVASAVVPTVLMAMVSAELPVIIGGLVSMLVSVLLVKHGVGLCRPCALTTPVDIETCLPAPHAVKAASAAPTSAACAALAAHPCVSGRHSSQHDVTYLATGSSSEHAEADTFSTVARGGSMCSSASSSSISAEVDSTASVTDDADCNPSAPDDCSGAAVIYIEDETVDHTPSASLSRRSVVDTAIDAVSQHPAAVSPANGATPCLSVCPCCGGQQYVGAAAKDVDICMDKWHCKACAAATAASLAAAHKDSSGASPAEAFKGTTACTAEQQQPLHPTEQDVPQQQHLQQQQQPRVLPLVYVCNRATGDHVLVSGFDKLPEAVKLLLRPGYVITTHGRFHAHDTPPAELPQHSAKHHGAADQQLGSGDCHKVPAGPVPWLNVVLRTLPIWLTVVLLLVTRVPVLKLQDLLRCKSTSLTIHLGTLGSLSLSPALVLQLQGLFTLGDANWTVELLYMPCLIPFVLVSCVTLLLFQSDLMQAGVSWRDPFATAWNKLKGIVPAMLGALVLAQLMSAGGQGSPAYVIAYYLTTWMGKGYLGIAGFLGAVGSFVSGSVMAGNMTQGAIQATAAARLGVPVTSMLAVQVAGACAGKMVCVSSILSAKVVLSELRHVNESEVIRRIGPLALLFVLLAQVLGLMWTLAGVWPDAA